MGNRVTKEKLVAWKSEVTLGTDPFGGDPTVFEQTLEATIMDVRTELKDEGDRASASPGPQDTVPLRNDVTIESYLFGKASDAGDPPHCDAIFRAAGLKPTVVASTSCTYLPVTDTGNMTECPAVHIKVWERTTAGEWMLCVGKAVRGNLSITGEVGQQAKWKFEGKGRYTKRANASSTKPSLPSSYSGNKRALVVRGITLTVGGVAFKAKSFEVKTNWSLVEDDDATSDTGIEEVHLRRSKGAAMTLGLNFLRVEDLEAVLATYDDAAPDASAAIVITLTDGTDTVSLECPVAVPGNYTGQAGEVREWATTWDLAGDYDGASAIGDNELSIEYT